MDSGGDPPQLCVDLPSINKIQVTTKQPKLPIDILLLTVEDCEFLACYQHLKHPLRCYFDGLGYIYFEDVDKRQEEVVKVVLLKCWRGGFSPGGSLITVKNAAQVLRPKAVISVGTCVGLNSKKTKLGDVVVSTKLRTYAEAKVNQVQSTGESYVSVSRRFCHLIKNCADGWQAPLKNSEAQEVKVHCGEFLRGPELVSTEWQCKQLTECHPQAVAVEIDGEGIFAAAFDLHIEWLIVKGISHFGDSGQLAVDSWRAYASVMAASLVANILSDPCIFHSWPHFEEPSSELLAELPSIPEESRELLVTIIRSLEEWQDIEKTWEGVSNLQECVIPALDGMKLSEKNFQTLLQTVWNSLKLWGDCQTEFIVLNCSGNEDFNLMSCLTILSLFAYTKGDTKSLEGIQTLACRYKHHPGSGFVISNLGVMFSEEAHYEKSGECFVMAKSYFQCQQDHLRVAAVILNQAALHKAVGEYKKAQSLCSEVPALCHSHSISTIKAKNAHLLVKVLGRVADMLEEFVDYGAFYKTMKICVDFDLTGTHQSVSMVLTRKLMKLRLKEEINGNVEVKEVKDFSYHLLTLLDNPDAELMNAEVVQVTNNVAKVLHKSGYSDEACNLLSKLQNAFLFVHSGNTSLYGLLLYQSGCFFINCKKFPEAVTALKQAMEILICHFGQEHHTVASCMSMFASCFLLMGNYKEALRHLNEARIRFRNLNPNHPEVGGILLKLSLLNIEETNFQCAYDIIEEALGIFISACGELSAMTATGYFQSAMLLLKAKALWNLAEEKLMTAIDTFLWVGLKASHSFVIACCSSLAVLQLSLGKREEAVKFFEDVEQQLEVNGVSWVKTRIISSPLVSLPVSSPSLKVCLDRSFDLCAKVVSLVNLVHLQTGDERYRHLNLLVNFLEGHKTEELKIKDFAGQDVCYILHRLPVFDRPVVCILSSDPKLISSESSEPWKSHSVSDTLDPDDQSEGSHMFLSSVNNKHFVLFLRVPHNIQEDISFLASCLQKSVLTLFSQPSFRKGFVERDDLYREMTVPTLNLCFLWTLIDCLPLLVELELSELHHRDNFDYLNSWQSSMESSKQSLKISYFSSECSNQREAEFVFDRLTHSLHEKLALSKVHGGGISHVSPVQNAASFVIEKPGKSCISVAVENKGLIVKCCSFKESDLVCICSSVREALESTIESSGDIVSVNFEQSSWLHGQGGYCESLRQNCNSDLTGDLFCSVVTLETGDFPCAISRDPESDLKRQPTVGVLQDQDVGVRPLLCRPCSKLTIDMDVCLCLLKCLLSQARPEATKEQALESCNNSSSSFDSRDSDGEVNQNQSISSVQKSVSENHSTFPESDDSFIPKKSLYDSLSSVESTKELNPHLSLDQSDSEASSYRHLSNREEVIVDISSDPDTKEMLYSTTEFTYVSREKNLRSVVQKTGSPVHTNTGLSVANSSTLLLNNENEHLDIYQNPKQGPSVEPSQSISRPSSAANSGENVLETVTGDFENVLAASRKEVFELQLEIRQLEEQLKQSEEEKRKLQVDLGKYLFFEEKERRRGRLLGGAASLHDPGYSLHSRLLEISNSLSAEEVKKIKFLVKSKISGFRLARITETFELFEELEANGLFPCHYIANLLAGIQRYDLVEKLGIHVALTATKEGSDIHSRQGWSARENRLVGHNENSPQPTSAQDYGLGLQPRRCERKQHVSNGAELPTSIEGGSVYLRDVEENDKSFTTEEAESERNQNSSVAFSESSREVDNDATALSVNGESSSSSMQSALSTEEFPQLLTLTSDGYLSNSNESSMSSNFEQTALVADSSCTLQFSSDSTDGPPILTLVSGKAFRNGEVSVYTDPNAGSTEEQTERRSQKFGNTDEECDSSPMLASLHSYSTFGNSDFYTTSDEGELFSKTTEKPECEEIEEEVESVDSFDGAIRTEQSGPTAPTGTDSSDSFASEIVGTQSVVNGDLPSTQQGAFSTAERGLKTQSAGARDWERLGARPKQARRSDVGPEPKDPVGYITEGLAGDFLARHTQDKALHDSIYQTDGMPFFNDIPSQDTSYIDGNMSQSNRAQPFFGDCQAASATEPFGRFGKPLVSGPYCHLGGFSYGEPFSNNSGPWPNHFGDSSFSRYSNYLSRNTSGTSNSYSLHIDFVHSSSRFTGVGHFDGPTYLRPAQQVLYPPTASDPILNSYSGMTGSSFADPSWAVAAQTSTSNEQPGGPVQDAKRFTGNGHSSALMSGQGTEGAVQEPNVALGNSSATTNIGDVVSSTARYQSGNSTTFSDEVLAGGSTHRTSILDPVLGDTDNSRGSRLNNRDFGTDSVESSDNSLLALERRVAEACALVERVLREREEREQFGKEIERKEQLIREQRTRERREREERELREAESWPQQQEAITARSQWLCEHYQRHCRVRFPCCTQFYPCHRCHNISKACENDEAKACHATHLKCSHCQHEQEIGEDSAKCRKCGGKMSAYFCAICKHFTSVDKNPYHCEKCGICRIHQDKSFHCEVCNVCLDKRLEGNHKCRPDSGHDECCICLEDAFSGCQILPCSHKVHRECAIAMIQNGIRTCPICRHPLYSQPRE